MSVVRQTICWTVFFIWGWAYLMPVVPSLMVLVWVYEKRRDAMVPAAMVAAAVWAGYAFVFV